VELTVYIVCNCYFDNVLLWLYQDAGDFASTAFFILKPRCPDRGMLMIQDVNSLLDDVAMGHASKDKGLVRRALGRLLRELSAREQKWLIRIIVKEMKTGLSQHLVFSSYHVDAEDLYNVKMSLQKVCICASYSVIVLV